MILDKSVYARRKPKKMNFDYRACIRMNKEEVEEFKDYYGARWNEKVREIMREQLKRDKEIAQQELIKRKKYLHNAYTVSND